MKAKDLMIGDFVKCREQECGGHQVNYIIEKVGEVVVRDNIMKDEEKIREIIKCGECESISKCDYKNTGINCYSYGVAMRVAAWKEQQMIEKACNWLIKGGYFVNNNETIEDFRKAMEE